MAPERRAPPLTTNPPSSHTAASLAAPDHSPNPFRPTRSPQSEPNGDDSHAAVSDERSLRYGDFVLEPFRQSSDGRAAWQVLSTLAPVAGLWGLVAWIGQAGWPWPLSLAALLPVIVLLVLFSARTFSLMHDCGHNALFRSRWLNRLIGFWLGVINAIPQHPWSRGHAFHHRHNGNWERYQGPSALVTLERYRALPPRQRWLYGVLRQPLMLLPGGFFYLVIKPRLALLLGSVAFASDLARRFGASLSARGWRALGELPALVRQHRSKHWYTSGELADLVANNLLVIGSWVLMARWLGAGLFWSTYALVMGFSAAIFICIFFVQHNFSDTYAHGSADWNPLRGAVEGSSNLEMPPLLHWFSADIGYHSIHHLCERIPNYNLRACHERNAHLLGASRRLQLVDIPDCFAYILWDEANQRLTTLADAEALMAAGSTGAALVA